ncbi:hypothetical protein R1flu_029201 [Riccia fluitans]|uniref:Uncharacterized protein n=1 Tax=Riccia fluitans TaxID=41844 RepID=A0ABD1XNV1_9MARC
MHCHTRTHKLPEKWRDILLIPLVCSALACCAATNVRVSIRNDIHEGVPLRAICFIKFAFLVFYGEVETFEPAWFGHTDTWICDLSRFDMSVRKYSLDIRQVDLLDAQVVNGGVEWKVTESGLERLDPSNGVYSVVRSWVNRYPPSESSVFE